MSTPTKEQLEAEIEATRAELGETVNALSHKLDVRSRIQERVRSLPPAVSIGAGVAVALTVALVVWRRRS